MYVARGVLACFYEEDVVVSVTSGGGPCRANSLDKSSGVTIPSVPFVPGQSVKTQWKHRFRGSSSFINVTVM